MNVNWSDTCIRACINVSCDIFRVLYWICAHEESEVEGFSCYKKSAFIRWIKEKIGPCEFQMRKERKSAKFMRGLRNRKWTRIQFGFSSGFPLFQQANIVEMVILQKCKTAPSNAI